MDSLLFMKILGLVLFLIGGVVFYTANIWVKKFNLTEKMKAPNEEEYDEEGLVKYKQMKAQLTVKLISLVVLLPGIILLLIAFK